MIWWYDHDLCNLFNGKSTAPATFGNADFISDWWAAAVPLKRSCKAALRCWGTLEVPKTALLKWILTRWTLITYPHLNLFRILKLQFDHMVMTKHAPLSTLKPAKLRWITEFGQRSCPHFLKGHSHSRIPAAWSCCHDNIGANTNSNGKCSKYCSGQGPKIKILRSSWWAWQLASYYLSFAFRSRRWPQMHQNHQGPFKMKLFVLWIYDGVYGCQHLLSI